MYEPREAIIIKTTTVFQFPSITDTSKCSGIILNSSLMGENLWSMWMLVTKMHIKPDLLFYCPDAMNDFVVVFILDTPEHHVNTSDMYSVPNTLEFGNRTYKIIRANMTWYTAGRACLMHGAELASITDSFHQAFLTVILNRLGHAHWIGLSTTDVGVQSPSNDLRKASVCFLRGTTTGISMQK